MSRLPVLRVRSVLVGVAVAALAIGSLAAPVAAAESGSSSSSNNYSFTLGTTEDVTIFPGPTCPALPMSGYMCGSNVGVKLLAANTGGDKDLTGTVTEDFFSQLSISPVATRTCAAAVLNYSKITIHTAHGDISMETHDGSYCTTTNVDIEPFTITGGTGKYAGATGSGTIYATQTKPMALTADGLFGYAAEVYRGSISLPSSSRR
jgi:hypothetical protein